MLCGMPDISDNTETLILQYKTNIIPVFCTIHFKELRYSMSLMTQWYTSMYDVSYVFNFNNIYDVQNYVSKVYLLHEMTIIKNYRIQITAIAL